MDYKSALIIFTLTCLQLTISHHLAAAENTTAAGKDDLHGTSVNSTDKVGNTTESGVHLNKTMEASGNETDTGILTKVKHGLESFACTIGISSDCHNAEGEKAGETKKEETKAEDKSGSTTSTTTARP